MTTRLKLLLAGLAIVAAALLYDQMHGGGEVVEAVKRTDGPSPSRQIVEPPAVPAGGAALNPKAQATLDDFSVIVERPLFVPSRRPPPAVADLPTADGVRSAVAVDFALEGVVIGDRGRVAVLRRLSDGSHFRLKIGQSSDGWTVSGISARSATIESGPRRQILKLFPAPAAGATRGEQPLSADPAPDGAESPPAIQPPDWIDRARE